MIKMNCTGLLMLHWQYFYSAAIVAIKMSQGEKKGLRTETGSATQIRERKQEEMKFTLRGGIFNT